MPAFVEHLFKRGYVVDEERLRRLREIIEKRTAPAILTYKVYRGDSYSYTTNSVDDVAKEENEDWKRITRLELTAEDADRLQFSLEFSSQGCLLQITGTDRDHVFLLFSDLREYVGNEVATVRRGQRGQSESLRAFIFLSVAAVVTVVYTRRVIVSLTPSDESVRQALDSADIHTKLDFLIKNSTHALGWSPFLPLFLVVPLVVLFPFIGKVKAYLYPANIFLFGRRKQAFEQRIKLISNLFWIVVVGLAVSTIAGFLVWVLTKRK